MFLQKHGMKASLLASAIALTGCGSSSDDNNSGRAGTSFESLTLSATGGSSTIGYGADGGSIEIYKTNSTNDLNVKKSGKVDTSYELPEQTAAFGLNSVTISEDTSIVLLTGGDDFPLAGDLYMLSGNYQLFRSTGDGTLGDEDHVVTGLMVEEGATLFLPANSGSSARVHFNNDIQNDGTITTINGEIANRVSLYLTAAAYYANGDIDLKGATANYHRQSGGQLGIFAYTVINAGSINTSGANFSDENLIGDGGGNAGYIDLIGSVFLENSGDIRANGGFSDADYGTYGADINLYGSSVINTGSIKSNSGTGTSNNYSSSSSDVSIVANRAIINTGSIEVLGADVVDSGNAGRGGDIELFLAQNNGNISYDQKLLNTGDLNVNGGSINGSSTGLAGYGGSISIWSENTYQHEYSRSLGPVRFEVTGNLTANGGNTGEEVATAGRGGYIWIAHYDNITSTDETYIVGYDTIDVSGGNGIEGGEGGSIEITFSDYRDELSGNAQYVPVPSASVYNDVDLAANGGTSTAAELSTEETEVSGTGSDAGDVYIAAYNYSAFLQEDEINVTNKGNISLNGGDSFFDSYRGMADGGSVYVEAAHDITLTGAIEMNGGDDLHTANIAEILDHAGSNGGALYIGSQYGSADVDATIAANGGQGDLIGGHGGFVNLLSKANSTLDGVIELNGGNAIANEEDSLETEGGNGGYLFMVAESMGSKLEADLTANSGTGDETGNENVVYVDADCLSDNCQLFF